MPQESNEPIKARSATALADGEKVVLLITIEGGESYLFELPEPLLTLDTLRNAESIARMRRREREAKLKSSSDADVNDL